MSGCSAVRSQVMSPVRQVLFRLRSAVRLLAPLRHEVMCRSPMDHTDMSNDVASACPSRARLCSTSLSKARLCSTGFSTRRSSHVPLTGNARLCSTCFSTRRSSRISLTVQPCLCRHLLAHGRDTSCWRDRAGRSKTEPLRRQAKQSTPELRDKTRTETQRGTASNKMERLRVPLPTPAGSVKTVDRAEAESLGQVSGLRGALWTKMC